MEVSNPRRVLAVSLDGQADHLSRVIKELTGSAPKASVDGLAGTTHDLVLRTQYYKATVPVWLDLVSAPSEWAASFLSEEAGEVLAVLGALVVVFAMPAASPPPAAAAGTATASAASENTAAEAARELIRQVGRVVGDGLGGWEWDGVRLAVGVGESKDAEEWDELCAEAGMEFVQVGGGHQQPGLNEFGEKTGIARVREALEANDWAQADAASALSDFGDFEAPQETQPDNSGDLDPENLDFGFDKADFEGLKKAIWSSGQEEHGDAAPAEVGAQASNGAADSKPDAAGKELQQVKETDSDTHAGAIEGLDDDDVAKVEKMMRKLQAVREAGAGMGEAQRRKMAAKAVAEVMREL